MVVIGRKVNISIACGTACLLCCGSVQWFLVKGIFAFRLDLLFMKKIRTGAPSKNVRLVRSLKNL